MNGTQENQKSESAQNVNRHIGIGTKKLTQKRLKELLSYDEKTGIFTWIKATNLSIIVGSVAGHKQKNGYVRIGIDSIHYKTSRLVFLYMVGYFPEHEAEHINRIRYDDRWSNLREATHRCNSMNRGVYKSNKTGISGVCVNSATGKYRTTIRNHKRQIEIGNFSNIYDAALARWNAEKKYGYPNCNTVSSAFVYLKNNPRDDIKFKEMK